MKRRFQKLPGCVFLLTLAFATGGLAAESPLSDEALTQIRFDQKLGTKVSPSLLFHDETGQQVQLGQYFGRRPVLLVLGYYECPMLCTLVLNGMVESASDLKWSIGRDFEVIDVSINPHESSTLAAAKKRAYLKRYGRSGAGVGWHFLTGNESSIRQLADEVGFRYAYDPVSKQYAHASGLVILTPQGKVSGYLFGVTYASSELLASLQRASSNQIASAIRQFILLCFHYNPITGKYSRTILAILRVLGLATILGLVCLVAILVKPGRLSHASPRPAGSETDTSNNSSPAQFVTPLKAEAPTPPCVAATAEQLASGTTNDPSL